MATVELENGVTTRKRADARGTIHYLSEYERNVGNGQDTSETITKYYRALGRLIAFRRNGSLYWVGTDHLGGTVSVANSSFGLVAGMRYSPYGVSRDNTDDPLTDNLFTSQKLDASIGLYWYGSRAYDQSLGRFTCPDTVVASPANPQSLNRFSYAANNPMRYADPSGHNPYDGQGIVVYDNPSYLPVEQRQALYEHNSQSSVSNGSQGTVYVHESSDDGGSSPADPFAGKGIIDTRDFGVEPSYLPVEIRQALYEHNTSVGQGSISGGGQSGSGSASYVSLGYADVKARPPDPDSTFGSYGGLGSRNWNFFLDWVFEQGPAIRTYGPETPETKQMQKTPGVGRMRKEFYSGGMKNGGGDYGWADAAVASFGDLRNGMQLQVGGYQYSYTNNGDGTVTFVIKNEAERKSFFLHAPFVEPADRGLGQWFGGGTITQYFYWTEPIVN